MFFASLLGARSCGDRDSFGKLSRCPLLSGIGRIDLISLFRQPAHSAILILRVGADLVHSPPRLLPRSLPRCVPRILPCFQLLLPVEVLLVQRSKVENSSLTVLTPVFRRLSDPFVVDLSHGIDTSPTPSRSRMCFYLVVDETLVRNLYRQHLWLFILISLHGWGHSSSFISGVGGAAMACLHSGRLIEVDCPLHPFLTAA